jgi:hypothetical protein
MTHHVTFAVATVSKFLSTNITLKFNKELSMTYFHELHPCICVISGFHGSEHPYCSSLILHKKSVNSQHYFIPLLEHKQLVSACYGHHQALLQKHEY